MKVVVVINGENNLTRYSMMKGKSYIFNLIITIVVGVLLITLPLWPLTKGDNFIVKTISLLSVANELTQEDVYYGLFLFWVPIAQVLTTILIVVMITTKAISSAHIEKLFYISIGIVLLNIAIYFYRQSDFPLYAFVLVPLISAFVVYHKTTKETIGPE